MNYLYPDFSIVQFAKAPEAGRVKTRLQPALGEQGCLQLHIRLVSHCFDTLQRAAIAPMQLSVTGASLDFFYTLVADNQIPITRQWGGDLGERMHHAALEQLSRHRGVIIVGSDCPSIDIDYLQQACQRLADGDDCVLGPATDGGYVLIGLRRVDKMLFSDIPWGTDRVLEFTRQRLQALGWRWHALKPLADIDRPEDLSQLQSVPGWGAI